MRAKKYPKRGEVWMINLGVNQGSEQNGIRPAIVLNRPVKKERTCVIVPASSRVRNHSCVVSDYNFLVHQLRAIDTTRLMRKVERFTEIETNTVRQAIEKFIQ